MNGLCGLLETFRVRGDRTALIYRSGVRRFTCSYAELYLLAGKMAAFLEAAGVSPGDRVLLWGPNHPSWAVSFWGIVARGAVAVPVDFMSGQERAQSIASLSGAVFAIQSRVKTERLAGLQTAVMEDLELLLKGHEPRGTLARGAADDLCELVYTSGTTGAPKGVALSHKNLISNVLQVSAQFPSVSADYRFLSLLPLSHMFEQTAGFLTPLYLGGSIIYLRTLKPSAIMNAFAEEDVYAMIAVPRLLQLLRGSMERELETKGLSGLFARLCSFSANLPAAARKKLFFPIQRKFGKNFRMFVSGGAPLSPDTFRFWNTAGFTVVEGYGLSECAPVLATNTVERQICGAVGWAVPGVGLRLEDGEVQASGDNIFAGYYGNEAATKEAFTADGWFRTGDIGEYDADGALVIKGRAKDVIITGAGINVYPDELEDLLLRIPGVRDGCVIGLDRGSGEEVHAVIVPDGSGRALDEIVTEVNAALDELHRISGFSVWPDPELPKTTTLKVQKFIVKKRLLTAAESGGEQSASADRLCTMIAQLLGCPVADIREDSCLVADLGLTSIARLELANALEQEFRIDLDDAAIGPQTRVADLRGMIVRRDKSPQPQGLRLWTAAAPVRAVRRVADALLHSPLYRLFVTLQPEGLHNLDRLNGPVMFIANHVSYLDQPTIKLAMPPAIRYRVSTAAWAEFFFVNFNNALQHAWKRLAFEYCSIVMGVFPLPQSSGFRATLQHMGKLVDRGESLLLFPEGERTEQGGLLPFQNGLGVMVQELGIPVVPVVMIGLEHILPRGASWPQQGKVRVVFGAPLDFSGRTAAEIVRLSEEAIKELLDSCSG
ncbi:MAG: AMP-binding protein [Deltaproteobacteria bacterium]|nr:AMP-binding protein [Deltaproteobacteria bacterium]